MAKNFMQLNYTRVLYVVMYMLTCSTCILCYTCTKIHMFIMYEITRKDLCYGGV